MDGPRAGALGRRLRRLDEPELARFVAALWAETECETTVRENRVVLRRRSDADPEVVRPLASYRSAAAAIVDPPDVDAVVVPYDGAARALAVRGDLEVLDVASVHERLTYGVSPEERSRLIRRHLDVGPSASRRAVLSSLAVGLGVSTAAASRPGEPCFAAPIDAVTRQLETVREASSSRDDDGEVVDWSLAHRQGTTSAFREALAEVDSRPLLRSADVTVRRGEYQPGRVAVRAIARTADGTRVIYEFTYADGAPDCATIRGVTLLRREPPG